MKTAFPSFFSKIIVLFVMIASVQLPAFAQQDSAKYPLILDFYSIGTGVPGDEPLKKYIADYRKKNKLKPLSATLIGGLGREGEYAIVFSLKELTTPQKKKFIESLTKALPNLKQNGENGGINISTNQPMNTGSGRVPPQKITL